MSESHLEGKLIIEYLLITTKFGVIYYENIQLLVVS